MEEGVAMACDLATTGSNDGRDNVQDMTVPWVDTTTAPFERGLNEPSHQRDWSDMVHEGLVHAFSFLPVRDRYVISAVCKSWHRAFRDPGCWTEAVLDDLCRVLADQWRNRDDVDSDDDSDIDYPLVVKTKEEDGIDAVAKRMTLAMVVDDIILRSHGRLRKLSVECCPEHCLSSIGKHCQLIEELRFAKTDWLCLDIPVSIGAMCSRLKTLDLRETTIPYDAIGGFDQIVISIAKGCPELVSLLVDEASPPVTDDAVVCIGDGLRRLQSLGLSGSAISDASLSLIGKQLPALRFLWVDFCAYISIDGLILLRHARKDLEVFAKELTAGSDSGGGDDSDFGDGVDWDWEHFSDYDDDDDNSIDIPGEDEFGLFD